MKDEIELLGRLERVRATKADEHRSRVAAQHARCEMYRDNIQRLERLCEFTADMTTAVQRDNQQHYKATLHKMLAMQRRELAAAENALERLQTELYAALRKEKIVTHAIETRRTEYSRELARHEQRLQDGLAAQSWWRARVPS